MKSLIALITGAFLYLPTFVWAEKEITILLSNSFLQDWESAEEQYSELKKAFFEIYSVEEKEEHNIKFATVFNTIGGYRFPGEELTGTDLRNAIITELTTAIITKFADTPREAALLAAEIAFSAHSKNSLLNYLAIYGATLSTGIGLAGYYVEGNLNGTDTSNYENFYREKLIEDEQLKEDGCLITVSHGYGSLVTNRVYEKLSDLNLNENQFQHLSIAPLSREVMPGGQYLTAQNDKMVQFFRGVLNSELDISINVKINGNNVPIPLPGIPLPGLSDAAPPPNASENSDNGDNSFHDFKYSYLKDPSNRSLFLAMLADAVDKAIVTCSDFRITDVIAPEFVINRAGLTGTPYPINIYLSGSPVYPITAHFTSPFFNPGASECLSPSCATEPNVQTFEVPAEPIQVFGLCIGSRNVFTGALQPNVDLHTPAYVFFTDALGESTSNSVFFELDCSYVP